MTSDIGQIIAKGQFHAALDALACELHEETSESRDLGWIYDEIGKLQFVVSAPRTAIPYFEKARENSSSKNDWVNYTIHLGVAYYRLSEYDTAQRYLGQLVALQNEVPSQTRGVLLLNVSAIEGMSGFYSQALKRLEQSLDSFSSADFHRLDVHLYNNLGLANFEVGNTTEALTWFTKALELSQGNYLAPVAEISRLYHYLGDLEHSLHYAQRALKMVWNLIINYEKEEVAILCHLLAKIVTQFMRPGLAKRLAEKAQIYYGQLGMWRQWQNLEAEISGFYKLTPTNTDVARLGTEWLSEVTHFINCLDALNGQELIDKSISRLLDMRVHYVKLFSAWLELSEEETEDLVLTSRFADLGLTALEFEVIENPERSDMTWKQYQQHPKLSVDMIQALHISVSIQTIILQHHENFDGTGYPLGVAGEAINRLARVFAVVDAYTRCVMVRNLSHADAINYIAVRKGLDFDDEIATSFEEMFL